MVNILLKEDCILSYIILLEGLLGFRQGVWLTMAQVMFSRVRL